MKIDKDVPIPEHLSVTNRKWRFDLMDVGDSFSFPALKEHSVRMCIKRWVAEHPEQKYVVRRTGDGLARCWRET